jgi:hypothetical protein
MLDCRYDIDFIQKLPLPLLASCVKFLYSNLSSIYKDSLRMKIIE